MTKYFIITDHSDTNGTCFSVQQVRPVMLTPIGYAAAFGTRAFAERYVREAGGVVMETTATAIGPYCPWPKLERWGSNWCDYPLGYDGPTFGVW